VRQPRLGRPRGAPREAAETRSRPGGARAGHRRRDRRIRPRTEPVRSSLRSWRSAGTAHSSGDDAWSRAPTEPAHTPVARVASVRPRPDVGSVRLTLRLDDLIGAVRVARVDQPDVGRARERVHADQAGLAVRDVRGSVTALEPGCGVGTVDVPRLVPLIRARIALVERLAPDLERETGAVTAFTAGVRVARRITGRVVDVVVVPAAS
jgi:hypothetical protein